MKLALDTNILASAEGVNGSSRQIAAISLVARLPPADVFVPVQVLAELFQVLVRKQKWAPAQARHAILIWQDSYGLIPSSETVLLAAADLAATHRFSIWDGVVLAAAAEGDCRLLLSEDLQDGFTWNGVTVTNPFGKSPHPLLHSLLV